MKIKRIVGGNLESNGYILFQREGGSCFVIDPGYNADQFVKQIKELHLKTKGILLTHHHYDHTGAVERLRELEGCPVYMHWGDLDMYKAHVDTVLEHGMKLDLDGEEIMVLHTPGHTEGGVCFYSEKSRLVFTGDTIFNVDLGRTDLKDGSEHKMKESIKNVVNKWENDIQIYPGHGDSCNMKFVRKYNREFLDIIG
ncbi:MBL fold metallo-hydrolase [Aminipila luticellarii]|uniref:MBL fold metallo-hydrolase n=1 Tax=Aminipila luticellarii TaxID=2507160 RepID=A0A410PWD5_9FIRM|nr:MBL fold metallo-hydrolase [Aminipila luticellarii]QAT43210.1 MBL fold metallo-hydrolase [Aminipila luticellarii]